ncbi:MAG: winged helix-turn-helix domain-containing protein [Bacteroidales bacterium]|nr:winged helix-turn-helix domain-containing protein [Bacteroidales bacterium]
MNKIEIIYHSGIILKHLQEHGELSVSAIREITCISESDIMMAIGWLACERRILVRKYRNRINIQIAHVNAEVYSAN